MPQGILQAAAFTSPVETRFETAENALSEVVGFSVGEAVYDASWYPQMNAYDAQVMYYGVIGGSGDEVARLWSNEVILDVVVSQTHCFITSCRDHPIQLWDANTGVLRASYR